jgi:uncharacterized C2H2 Zn-finger protein
MAFSQACYSPELLAVHIKTHTKENSVTCPICSKTLSSRKNGKEHLMKIHKLMWEDTAQVLDEGIDSIQ